MVEDDQTPMAVMLPRRWVVQRAKVYRFVMPETGDEPGEDIPGDACRAALGEDTTA